MDLTQVTASPPVSKPGGEGDGHGLEVMDLSKSKKRARQSSQEGEDFPPLQKGSRLNKGDSPSDVGHSSQEKPGSSRMSASQSSRELRPEKGRASQRSTSEMRGKETTTTNSSKGVPYKGSKGSKMYGPSQNRGRYPEK